MKEHAISVAYSNQSQLYLEVHLMYELSKIKLDESESKGGQHEGGNGRSQDFGSGRNTFGGRPRGGSHLGRENFRKISKKHRKKCIILADFSKM